MSRRGKKKLPDSRNHLQNLAVPRMVHQCVATVLILAATVSILVLRK